MGMAVAAAGHHKSLASVVHHLGLALFYKGFGPCLVAHIDVHAVLHGEGFHHLTRFGGKYLAIDHEVGTGFPLATGKRNHAEGDCHHCDAREHLLHTLGNCSFHNTLFGFRIDRQNCVCKGKKNPATYFDIIGPFGQILLIL